MFACYKKKRSSDSEATRVRIIRADGYPSILGPKWVRKIFLSEPKKFRVLLHAWEARRRRMRTIGLNMSYFPYLNMFMLLVWQKVTRICVNVGFIPAVASADTGATCLIITFFEKIRKDYPSAKWDIIGAERINLKTINDRDIKIKGRTGAKSQITND